MQFKRKITLFVVCFLIVTLLFCPCFYFINNATSKFPSITQANYNMDSFDSSITVNEFDKLAELVSVEEVGFTSECKSTYVKDQLVTPVLTTSNYFSLCEMQLWGEGITEEHINNKTAVVVISDELALKIYLNTNCIGKTFFINDREFVVSGIYKLSGSSFIDELSKDNKDRVYIPYTCTSELEKVPLHTLVYNNKSNAAPIIEQMNLTQYYFTNFSEKSNVLNSFKDIAICFLLIGLSFVLMYVWWFFCKRIFDRIRNDLKEHYFLQSIKSIPINYILLVFIGIGVPVLFFILVSNAQFSVYIVAQYIPYDNIFDISYYRECILENESNVNSLLLVGSTYLIELYRRTFSVVLVLLFIYIAVCLLFLFLLISCLKQYLQNR